MMILNKYNGYQADGSRLYYKGGDGGAGAARQMEAERQARINAAVQTINNIFDPPVQRKGINIATSFDPNSRYYDAAGNVFAPQIIDRSSLLNSSLLSNTFGKLAQLQGREIDNSNIYDMSDINKLIASGQLYTGVSEYQPEKRDKLYEEQRQAVYDINAKDVNQQYQDAERNNRFGLARFGLMGGSADIDSNARLQEKTNEGLMRAKGMGDDAAASLKLADERSKQSLISMAQSGIDTGTAQSMAMQSLDAQAQNALGARAGAAIGNIFSNLSQAYLNGRLGGGGLATTTGFQETSSGNSTRASYAGNMS